MTDRAYERRVSFRPSTADNPNVFGILENEELLATAVTKFLVSGRCIIVALDGVDGTGKTTLARSLAARIGAEVLSLDKYLPAIKRGEFVAALDLTRLNADIAAASTRTEFLIVEGVCVLDVLSKLDVKPDRIIYLRTRSEVGNYVHWKHYGGGTEVEAELGYLRRHFGDVARLDIEVLEYHRTWRPYDKADIIYERVEGGLSPAFIP